MFLSLACCMLYVFEDEECLAIYGYKNILHALFNFSNCLLISM